MVYLQHWHGWSHMKLLPSGCILCTPHNHAPCHFMQSHICKVYACLAVTCHLHFWQNDRGLLRATAVLWDMYLLLVVLRRFRVQRSEESALQALTRTGQENNTTQPKADKYPSFTFQLAPFHSCLSAVL